MAKRPGVRAERPPERYFEGLTEVVRLSDEGETTFLIEYDIHFIAEQQRWRP
ncbi:MAG TPA: hypothetical protein VE645_07625 [Pseudonocardiaceae bacterium]|nr:hypothetical protein [Pseudonocardiaceae bacterium]